LPSGTSDINSITTSLDRVVDKPTAYICLLRTQPIRSLSSCIQGRGRVSHDDTDVSPTRHPIPLSQRERERETVGKGMIIDNESFTVTLSKWHAFINYSLVVHEVRPASETNSAVSLTYTYTQTHHPYTHTNTPTNTQTHINTRMRPIIIAIISILSGKIAPPPVPLPLYKPYPQSDPTRPAVWIPPLPTPTVN
jgi:hypothetical protein